MTDLDRLVRGVLEHPADDTARVVLADYLDELGSPAARARAELIRVGVELARTPAAVGVAGPTGGLARVTGPNPDRARLTACVEALLKRWGNRFLPKPLRFSHPFTRWQGDTAHFGWDNTPATFARFERGFVAAVGIGLHLDPEASPMVHHGHQIGGLLRAVLAANPVTEATVTVDGLRPELRFTVSAASAGWWQLVAARDGNDPHQAMDYDTRRELVADVPGFVADVLATAHFEREPEPDWVDVRIAGEELDHPDDTGGGPIG